MVGHKRPPHRDPSGSGGSSDTETAGFCCTLRSLTVAVRQAESLARLLADPSANDAPTRSRLVDAATRHRRPIGGGFLLEMQNAHSGLPERGAEPRPDRFAGDL